MGAEGAPPGGGGGGAGGIAELPSRPGGSGGGIGALLVGGKGGGRGALLVGGRGGGGGTALGCGAGLEEAGGNGGGIGAELSTPFVFGGNGGACSRAGGGGGTAERAGGGGGFDGMRGPSNGGGTAYLPDGMLSSSSGVFGGRGGGGGPGFATFEDARFLEGRAGASFANFPASASGGGALNRGGGGPGGGDGCLGGDGVFWRRDGADGAGNGTGRAPLRGGGGAGAGPLDADVLPVFCGLILLVGGAFGGGGGGALAALLASCFFCAATKVWMKSILSAICDSVIPIAISSFFNCGSRLSMMELRFEGTGDAYDVGVRTGGGGSGDAEVCLWPPKSPPRKPCFSC